MGSMDSLRRQAAEYGLVLISQHQGEKISNHVKGIYNEVMDRHATDMRAIAAELRAGQEVAMFAPGEGGAQAADAMARTFESQREEMDLLALAAEAVVLTTEDRLVEVTYDEDGYTVEDYEHNNRETVPTEREARDIFEQYRARFEVTPAVVEVAR